MWSKVTLKQFIDLQQIKAADKDPMEKTLLCISVLENKDPKDIPIGDIHDLDYSWMEELPEEIIYKDIKIDDRYFRFELDARKMHAGAYITVMDTMKRAKEDPIGVTGYIHIILREIAQEKIGKKWEPCEPEVSDLFYERLTVDVAYPIAVFFSKLLKALMPHTLRYLAEQMQMKIQEVEDLLTSGGGLSPSTTSQVQTLLNGTKSQSGELYDSLIRLHTLSKSKNT